MSTTHIAHSIAFGMIGFAGMLLLLPLAVTKEDLLIYRKPIFDIAIFIGTIILLLTL